MKNHIKIYLSSLLALFLFSTSCSFKDEVCRDGSGEIIIQERILTGFVALESRGKFTINVFQDSSIKTQEILISAQENIIDLIGVRLAGQSLIIEETECYNSNEEVMINVRTPALSQLIVSGSGDIVLQDTVRKRELELVVNGSGNIRTIPRFPIISTTSCTATIKGSGTMELDFDATSVVNAAVDGSGTLILRGKANENSLSVNGSGNIKAFLLPVLTSTAEIIGAGIIELKATDSDSTIITSRAIANIQVSGDGTVRVKGNAAIKWNVSGSGKIERVD